MSGSNNQKKTNSARNSKQNFGGKWWFLSVFLHSFILLLMEATAMSNFSSFIIFYKSVNVIV